MPLKTVLFLIGLPLLLLSCAGPDPASRQLLVTKAGGTNEAGRTLETRFSPPPGYHRIPAPEGSYATFLRQTKLKQHGTPVHLYDGRVKPNPNVYAAVVDLDIGNKDLQQCADAVMRLRGEYFFHAGHPERIRFRFTNGFVADYSHWMQGYRPQFRGRQTVWAKTAVPTAGYQSFRQYMDLVFSYAGTLSLSRELQAVPLREMRIGDVLIFGGTPGHAVTVMDMAENDRGEKVYLLSQSYMPAQDIQILHNPSDAALSPWYRLQPDAAVIETPEWTFTGNQLKRFSEE